MGRNLTKLIYVLQNNACLQTLIVGNTVKMFDLPVNLIFNHQHFSHVDDLNHCLPEYFCIFKKTKGGSGWEYSKSSIGHAVESLSHIVHCANANILWSLNTGRVGARIDSDQRLKNGASECRNG